MVEQQESWSDGNRHDLTRHENYETSAIRAEIAETRERMSETLDEIGSRLNPHVVKEQVTQRVKEGIREATIGRVEHMARQAADRVNATGTSMADTIRDNPIPAAMVAIGLGWLFINGRNSSERSYRYINTPSDRRSPEYGLSDYTSERTTDLGNQSARERVGDAAHTARERMSDVGDAVKHRASDATDEVRERAGAIADRARVTADNVRVRALHLKDNAAQTTRRTATRVEDMYEDNPLALGALTLALGAAAGLAIPRTEREVEIFGATRDQVVDKVKDVAEETKEKVQHVTQRAMDEAKVAARDEGLSAP